MSPSCPPFLPVLTPPKGPQGADAVDVVLDLADPAIDFGADLGGDLDVDLLNLTAYPAVQLARLMPGRRRAALRGLYRRAQLFRISRLTQKALTGSMAFLGIATGVLTHLRADGWHDACGG